MIVLNIHKIITRKSGETNFKDSFLSYFRFLLVSLDIVFGSNLFHSFFLIGSWGCLIDINWTPA